MNIAPSRRRNIFNFWQEIFLTRWCTWLSWGSCLWRETEVSSSQVSTNCSSKPQNWVFTTTIITSLGFSLLRHQPSMLASLSYLIKEKLLTTRLSRNYFHLISFFLVKATQVFTAICNSVSEWVTHFVSHPISKSQTISHLFNSMSQNKLKR